MDLEFHQLDHRYEALRLRKPEVEKRLLASLAEAGQRVPIVVVAGEVESHFVVVDGYKRIRALRILHRDTVCAMRWELPEEDAILIDRFLRTRDSETALEQGWLLREMTQRFELKLEELSRRVGRSVSWVSRRLALVRELPEEVQERVRRGEIVAHAAMKHLVPLARANRRQCVRVAEGIAGNNVSSRQVAQLYAAWRDGTAECRERVAADPMLFVRAQGSLRDNTSTDLASLILRDCDILASTARRARRRLEEASLGVLLPPDREEIERAVRQCRDEVERFGKRLRKEVDDAEARDAGSDPGAVAART